MLEAVIGQALASEPGSRRSLDGVEHVRFVERGPLRAQVCGKMWELPDSTLHVFWLDVARDAPGAPARWTLYYDLDSSTVPQRFARDAADLLASPRDASWLVTLSGQ